VENARQAFGRVEIPDMIVDFGKDDLEMARKKMFPDVSIYFVGMRLHNTNVIILGSG